jgi:hypothetical protein
MSVFSRLLLFAALVFTALNAPPVVNAQGDGPRSQLLLPVGVNVVVPTYLNLSGNYNFAESILAQDGDITSDVFVLTYMRAFSLAGRYGQIWVNPIFGTVDGSGSVVNPNTGKTIPLDSDVSGLGDLLVNFKVGLIGTPALKMPDFAAQPQKFQLSAFGSISAPIGDYDSDRPLNLGTNIWAFRVGVPMVLPFKMVRRPAFFEFFPSVAFYTDNDEPTLGADLREQAPLFMIESHLTYNFTPKFWGGFDLRYRYGGETTTDGVTDDNTQNVLGGGISIGYSFHPAVSMQASYGQVLSEKDGSDLDMIRLKMAFMF